MFKYNYGKLGTKQKGKTNVRELGKNDMKGTEL
jgi:hypothetical protein